MTENPLEEQEPDLNPDLNESTKFKIDEENEEIWKETLEEGTTRGFELKTVHQFISFIQTGVQILKENNKLTNDDEIAPEEQQLLSDLGLFILRYGTFGVWKEERKKLKTDYNDAVKDLRVLDKQAKALTLKNNDLEEKLKIAEEKISSLEAEVEMLKSLEGKALELKNRNDELESKVSELSKLTADLMKKLKQLKEDLAKFEDLKSRNHYLEAEVKKFNAMLGFGGIDITEEFKQKMINENTLKISARFLHKGWRNQEIMLEPENINITDDIIKVLETLKKPLNSMKVRMNLVEFFNKVNNIVKEKTERYVHLFNRTENKPLNNSELKEFVGLEASIKSCIEFLQMLIDSIKKT